MNLQPAYDLDVAEDQIAGQIEQEVRRVDHAELLSAR
jgi:hypothetical protein